MPAARPQNTQGKPRKGLQIHYQIRWSFCRSRLGRAIPRHRNGLLAFLRRPEACAPILQARVSCLLLSETIYCSCISASSIGSASRLLQWGLSPASARARLRKNQRRPGRMTSRRTWRRADVVMHLPFTMCIPAPHPSRICVITLSD